MVTPVHQIFIHHTADHECHTQEECSKLMRATQHFHNVTRGWGDIGYNFLIGGDGKVYMARGWDKIGVHTQGMNSVSVAFCLMGNFMNVEPNNDMIETLKNLIECGVDNKYVAPDYQMHGHRDIACTACPGDKLYAIIKLWPHFVKGPLSSYICTNP
jgi:N-acetylmuramoyl-L-alanine amidase